SNYGSGSTDLAAPGSKIVSTVPDNKYLYYSGTSMAAPAVTAEAAIVSKKFSGETADVIVSIITHNTTESSAVKGKCKSNGLANVGKALEAKPKDIKYRDFALDTTEYTYDGTEKRPTVSVSRLKEGTDYEVVDSPEESIDAGTYSVLVNSKGDYDGSLELIYKINQVKPEVSLSSEAFTYDGGTKTVSVKVTGADGEEWEQDVDYSQEGTLSAKLPGSYSITVTPGDSWNYETITRSFTINVKPAGISKLSRLKKGFKVKASKQASKYVSGYQVRYSRNSDMSGASTKTIGTKYYRNTKSVKKLKKKTTYYVQVRTYKTIGGKKYYSAWSSTKSVKTK
ncbi:MAG: S8 family serine peptidase, partial [Bacillota bacterium]|nr:S8 family serine peptidase [Bacillota bacterium]